MFDCLEKRKTTKIKEEQIRSSNCTIGALIMLKIQINWWFFAHIQNKKYVLNYIDICLCDSKTHLCYESWNNIASKYEVWCETLKKNYFFLMGDLSYFWALVPTKKLNAECWSDWRLMKIVFKFEFWIKSFPFTD